MADINELRAKRNEVIKARDVFQARVGGLIKHVNEALAADDLRDYAWNGTTKNTEGAEELRDGFDELCDCLDDYVRAARAERA